MNKTRAQRRREERLEKKQVKRDGVKIEFGPTFDNTIEAIEYMERLMEEPDSKFFVIDEDELKEIE